MDFIKNWIFSVCITLILAVIFSIMTPKGSMGRFYKMIISMFIFVSFLYPVSNADAGDFKIDLPMFENNYNEQIENAEKNNAEAVIVNKLKEIGINASVSLEIEFKNSEIEIENLTVYVPDGTSLEEVREYILNELGMVAEVKYLGE